MACEKRNQLGLLNCDMSDQEQDVVFADLLWCCSGVGVYSRVWSVSHTVTSLLHNVYTLAEQQQLQSSVWVYVLGCIQVQSPVF